MAGLPPSDADLRIAVRVRDARHASSTTQAAAGRVLGVSAAQFQKYEAGTNRLTGGMLQALADLFSVSVASFFDHAAPDPAVAMPGLAQAEASLLAAAETYAAAKLRAAEVGLPPLAQAA